MAFSTETLTQQYAAINFSESQPRSNVKASHGKELGKQLTKDVLRERIRSIDTDTCAPGEEDAFFVVDMGEVYRQHLRWKMNLKRVKPHYGESFSGYALGIILTMPSCQMQP